MNAFIGSDTLEFITLANLRSAIQLDGECCDACLTGNYPHPPRSHSGERGSLVSRLLEQPSGGLTYQAAVYRSRREIKRSSASRVPSTARSAPRFSAGSVVSRACSRSTSPR